MALEEIQAKFGGRWKLDRGENFEDFLKEMGVNIVARKLASKGTPELEVEVKDGKIRISFHSVFITKHDVFTLDEEYENETNKVKSKVITTYTDGKLDTNSTPIEPASVPPQRTVREMIDGEMKCTIYVREVVCTRIYKRM